MYATPKPGASLLVSLQLHAKTALIIGAGPLAASRAFAALEADSSVVVLSHGPLCAEMQWRVDQGQLAQVDFASLAGSSTAKDSDLLESYLTGVQTKIAFVCVTDTIIGSDRRTRTDAAELYAVCTARGIPVNTTDIPDLCDFTFASTHRFEDSLLQVAVTTNGQGCRLAGRIRREIVARLPKDVGAAVIKVGELRALVKGENHALESTPNRPVPARSVTETALEVSKRRMKWVAQVSEYWPIPRLATMSDSDMKAVLNGGAADEDVTTTTPASQHSLVLSPNALPPKGRIFLVGSGPGHPALLTFATHAALTKHAQLVLSDKLVPEAVLALIPKGVEIRIARKFPGNAEGAQNEMMEAAVEAARRGLTVVRLKQGDPVVYGRAGEEVLYFRRHGFEALVIPGVSSALAAPIFAGIPVTQRGVAESFVVCTGVGRAGKEVSIPGYERSRTLVVLMGVARLEAVVKVLCDPLESSKRPGAVYPAHTPIAIIERASMPDQRVTASTLGSIVDALASGGDQRPPGMMVIGWAALALWGEGDVGVLDEDEGLDEARVKRWLDGKGWRVSEGLEEGWGAFEGV